MFFLEVFHYPKKERVKKCFLQGHHPPWPKYLVDIRGRGVDVVRAALQLEAIVLDANVVLFEIVLEAFLMGDNQFVM